jgi:hypothetical protein
LGGGFSCGQSQVSDISPYRSLSGNARIWDEGWLIWKTPMQ